MKVEYQSSVVEQIIVLEAISNAEINSIKLKQLTSKPLGGVPPCTQPYCCTVEPVSLFFSQDRANPDRPSETLVKAQFMDVLAVFLANVNMITSLYKETLTLSSSTTP